MTNENKKAQLQIQFNWIFVIIVGSVFLLFFFGIINNQSETNDTMISISQSKYFETIITTTGQKEGTLKQHNMGVTIQVDFECNAQDNEYSYSVGRLPARDTKYDVIFSQETLSGEDIQTWTQIWEVPFKAATFLYMTNSKQGYVLYNASDELGRPKATTQFENLHDEMVQNISLEIVDDGFSWEKVNKRKYESTTYIFLDGELPGTNMGGSGPKLEYAVFSERKTQIRIIKPGKPGNEIFDYGKVYFLTENNYTDLVDAINRGVDDPYYAFEGHVSSYMGKASLYGAVFSEDKDVYECNMQKAFKRLKLVTQLYYLRTDSFKDSPQIGVQSNCEQYLGYMESAGGTLHARNRLGILYNTTIPEVISSSKLDQVLIEDLFDDLDELKDNNRNLLRVTDCPTIY